MTFSFPYGLTVPEPVSGDEIVWHLIRLGIDCGLDGKAIAGWLMKLEGFPMWPPPDALEVYLRDAGL